MKETRIAVWDAVIEQCSIMMEDDKNIVMYTDSEQLFHQNFNYYYHLILDKFMKLPDEHLDRHKIAAVIICSILKSDILGISCSLEAQQSIDDIFLANEKLAFNIALSYMHQKLIDEFKAGKIPFEGIFDDYTFPRPLSCDRDYTEVICRDLFFAKKYFELDPLSIANFLFLLEEYSFEASHIPINVKKWEYLSKTRQKEQCEKELKCTISSLSELDNKFKYKRQELELKKKALQDKLEEMNKEA